ncbi:Eco57I restriction-modification methylase domain-containing protein [Clostridium thermarum]|uniref:Eco57I restriction-modification methylase domain-containing protein n=1 Tax=Clostridium thermarum TaxID=1716543 RepID=UPI0013D2C87D|nr:N-6 DNA methylase [Clostridium thermarum]
MNFSEIISALYDNILNTKDSVCKIDNIKRCKYFLDLKEEDTLGNYYYEHVCTDKNGVVYTPEDIAIFMIENTLKDELIKNPFLRILDPSCGSGNILLSIFDYIKNIYVENINTINEIHGLNLNLVHINKHIVDNNLYGIDIDDMALKVLTIDLYAKAGYVNVNNLMHKDFLLSDLNEKYHVIIGNPPYIGTKALDKDYSNTLRNIYPEVFNDKGDISYCFFAKALKSVHSDYKITFITSRYFMESLSGVKLREFLLNHSSVHRIFDFYGIRPFKGAGIDPVIIFLGGSYTDEVKVNKPRLWDKQIKKIEQKNYSDFYIKRENLNHEPWRLHTKEHLEIIDKVERRCSKKLGELCETYQGIITGFDKAFIVTEEIVEENNIERNLLRPWIKNSNITKKGVVESKLLLIYSNLITSVEEYPNAVRYIGKHKERLMKRRECAKGKRKWYELQWGRETSIFERDKIIFPFKCEENRFIKDASHYFSADVYALNIRPDVNMNYEFLESLLNSKLYEFYFKSFAKKLGGKLYEYYPNNLNRLYIPTDKNHAFKTDEELYDFFNLSSQEVDYIETSRG